MQVEVFQLHGRVQVHVPCIWCPPVKNTFQSRERPRLDQQREFSESVGLAPGSRHEASALRGITTSIKSLMCRQLLATRDWSLRMKGLVLTMHDSRCFPDYVHDQASLPEMVTGLTFRSKDCDHINFTTACKFANVYGWQTLVVVDLIKSFPLCSIVPYQR